MTCSSCFNILSSLFVTLLFWFRSSADRQNVFISASDKLPCTAEQWASSRSPRLSLPLLLFSHHLKTEQCPAHCSHLRDTIQPTVQRLCSSTVSHACISSCVYQGICIFFAASEFLFICSPCLVPLSLHLPQAHIQVRQSKHTCVWPVLQHDKPIQNGPVAMAPASQTFLHTEYGCMPRPLT